MKVTIECIKKSEVAGTTEWRVTMNNGEVVEGNMAEIWCNADAISQELFNTFSGEVDLILND